MSKRKSKSAIGSQKSWKRANKLCGLAHYGNATLARSFIATNKEELEPILDAYSDKRNKKVRNIISQYVEWVDTPYE